MDMCMYVYIYIYIYIYTRTHTHIYIYICMYVCMYVCIIKLYCHIQRKLHDELECSLALTHIVPIYIYTIK